MDIPRLTHHGKATKAVGSHAVLHCHHHLHLVHVTRPREVRVWKPAVHRFRIVIFFVVASLVATVVLFDECMFVRILGARSFLAFIGRRGLGLAYAIWLGYVCVLTIGILSEMLADFWKARGGVPYLVSRLKGAGLARLLGRRNGFC